MRWFINNVENINCGEVKKSCKKNKEWQCKPRGLSNRPFKEEIGNISNSDIVGFDPCCK
jgi:hypothetical protein